MKVKPFFFVTYLTFLVITTGTIFAQQDNNKSNQNFIKNRVIFKILTKPGNAEVYMKGKLIGISPLNKLRAHKGRYRVIVYKDGYKPLKTTINVEKDGQEIILKLEKKPWSPKSNNLSLKWFIPFFSNLEKDLITSFIFSYKYFFEENHPLNNFDIEIETGLVNMEINYTLDGVPNSGTTALTILPISFNIHYNFFRNFRYISPYIGIGAGVSIINIEVDLYEKTSLTFSVMAGINFFTHWPVSFQFEIRYIWLGRAQIPKDGTSGDPVTINERTEYNFKGMLVNISVVGRF